MKKLFPSYLLLIITLLLVMSFGCSKKTVGQEEQGKEVSRQMVTESLGQPSSKNGSNQKLISHQVKEVTVYFLTDNEEYLVPVTIPINSTEQGAKAAIERLIVGSGDEIIRPVLHQSTKLRDIYLKGEQVYLDLTSQVLEFKSEEIGELAITSILKTLSPYVGERKILILVDGETPDITLGKYNLSTPLTLESDKEKNDDDEHLITVYYAEQNGAYLVPVVSKIVTPDPVKAAIIELVKGPGEQSGLIPTLWHGTKVLGVNIQDELVEINLSKEAFGYGGGSATENLFIKSLLLTMTEFPQIERVQLLFEGQVLDFLPEGTEVDKPLTRPDYINYKS